MELIERGAYLAALAEHLAAAVAGHGRLVLVGGEAGVGKTSLVRTFAEEQSNNARMAWGACDGLFTPEPLAPLLDLAGQLGGGLAAALAGDLPRREVFAETLDAVGSGPTIAVVEDVHWADEATLDLLRFLGRRLDGTTALVIATYRDDEIGSQHPLRIVLGDVEMGRRIALPPLSEDAVRGLAHGSDFDPGELYRQTGGNPFFVTEVLAAGGTGVPSSVRDAVLARAARLDVTARELLDAAAIVGTPADTAVVEEVLGRQAEGLDDCLAAGVLQTVNGGVGFRHELARRAVEEAIDPARRAALHAGMLAALSTAGSDDAARLAHHAEGAVDADAVLEHARAAAEKAAALGAHREAAEQYARALRFADGLPPAEVAELLESRSYECSVTLQVEQALTAAREALERYRALGDRLKEGDLLRWTSRVAYFAARLEEADELALAAVDVLEELPPGRELAMAYANMAHRMQLRLDDDQASVWGARALALADKLGEQGIIVNALTTLGACDTIAGRGPARLEQSLALAREHGTDEQVARVYAALVFASCRHRDWSAADRWLEEGIEYATERDLDDHRNYLVAWRADASLERGRWDEAAADARAALSHPHAVLHRVWSLLVLATLRARRGDPDVWSLLDEADGLVQANPPQRNVPYEIVRGEAAYLEGDLERARRELGTLAAADVVDRWMAGHLALWRWRAGAPAEETGPLPEPFALELAGDYAGAAAVWDELETPYNAALALAGSDDEEHLRRSHELLLALGARPTAAIVARKLRERGARGLARGPRPATREHPAGLTRRELEVLDLVAEGLTNAEIAGRLVIAEKTVGHHVSAILGKLGVSSRYEAAKLATQDRELTSPR
jgi:DNA-binding CsgD family transcriptional regulator/tetratricopeptide (TPR) repeat protein